MDNTTEKTTEQPKDIYCFEMMVPNGTKIYIEVVNTCKHHYTGETMRYCRFDVIDDGKSESWYEFVNETKWIDLLSRRVEKVEQNGQS